MLHHRARFGIFLSPTLWRRLILGRCKPPPKQPCTDKRTPEACNSTDPNRGEIPRTGRGAKHTLFAIVFIHFLQIYRTTNTNTHRDTHKRTKLVETNEKRANTRVQNRHNIRPVECARLVHTRHQLHGTSTWETHGFRSIAAALGRGGGGGRGRGEGGGGWGG